MADGVEQRLRDLGEFIRHQREGARLSLRGLSSRTGISNPYLSQIERGLRKPSADILQQIARGLAISAETLYERAGFLDQRPAAEPADVVAAIQRASDLDERQKQALIEVYHSMRRSPVDEPPGPAGDVGPGTDR
jgi:transcriptional regulator with XRE-family HTH domain